VINQYIELVRNNIKPNFRIAEVGVFEGGSARYIFPLLKEVTGSFVAVDSWEAVSEHAFLSASASWEKYRDIRQGISWEVAEQFPNDSFDFVFIDASHRYSNVVRDIRAWLPKVKVGGILAGHDYNRMWAGELDNTDDDVSEREHCGVSRAVREVFGDGFSHTVTPHLADVETWWVVITESHKHD